MGANIRAIGSATGRLNIAETLAGKELLVTGVTGFLGKVWLSELFCRVPEIGHVHLLIRPSSKASAIERFEHAAERSPAFRPVRETQGANFEAFLRDRVTVVSGDITQPMCGLKSARISQLSKRIDAVVHFAGLTDFDPDPRMAMDINVHGALNLADLTAKLKRAKFLHCSTCFVAGNVSGNVSEQFKAGVSPNGTHFDPIKEAEAAVETMDTVDEGFDSPRSKDAKLARLDAVRERAIALGWPNIYTYTKGLAEHSLAGRAMQKTTVRPAIVECSRSFPFAGWNEGINTSGPLIWFLSGALGNLPCKPAYHFDVVPVDTVSRGVTMALVALLRGEAETVYQLGSSATNAFNFGRALELTNLGNRKYHRQSGAKPVERHLFRLMDSSPREWDETPMRSVPGLKRLSKGLSKTLAKVDFASVAPPKLRGLAQTLNGQRDWALWSLSKADRMLDRLQRMLDAYKPFIHDNDYIFLSDNIQALSGRLEGDDVARYGWDIDTLEWRHYWVDVVYPGILKWTMPELHGKDAPLDPPMAKPLDLAPRRATKTTKAVS
ncbi:MAG: SDR family oxidoreductase [Myxococcota bacterium]